MDMLKSFFLHPLILSLVIGLLVFIFFYIRFPGILRFFKEKTLNSQEEVLHIVDMMMLKTPPEKSGCVALGFRTFFRFSYFFGLLA